MKYQDILKNRPFFIVLQSMTMSGIYIVSSANTSGFENALVRLIDIKTKFLLDLSHTAILSNATYALA